MRIAIFHHLPSGGAKRTLQEQTRRLTMRHFVDVYTLTSAEHEFADLRPFATRHRAYDFRSLPLLSSPFGRLNQAIRWIDLLRLERVYKRVAIDIEQTGYDVLLAHPCQIEQAPSVMYFVNRLPVVYYCHEPLRLIYERMPYRPYDQAELKHRQLLNRFDPLPGIYRAKLQRNDRRNTRAARLVLVNSDFTRAAVKCTYDVEAQVSYHGIDARVFRPLERIKQLMVLSVGSLTPLKGFDFVIRAVAHISMDQRPRLTIASNFQNPAERIYLEDLAISLGVDTQFLTNISDDCLVEHYNEAVVTAYAPVSEPFGLVPLESMACGTPVVAVREGGISESVVHGGTGLLVEREPAQFAQAIMQLLEDANLAAELGKRGREHVLKNWTWERAIASLEKHLNNATSLH